MHYDFKQKRNAIDSNKSRGFNIPEIDHLLNQGMQLFIDGIVNKSLEYNAWSINALRPLVTKTTVTPTVDGTELYSSLPTDFMYWGSGEAVIKKGTCTKTARLYSVQMDDLHEESPFSKSSFEWEEVNYHLSEAGIRMFTDGTFTITRVNLSYYRKPLYMHFAEGFGGYSLPDGTVLTGKQDCELPEQPNIHNRIVDLAVALTQISNTNPIQKLQLYEQNS